jgi:5-enolpyruvylshikimate-3-phosphate synthase
VTFERGVAWLTGSDSMAVRPIEEHSCALRGKGSRIKYATRWPRAILHAKPNISPISARIKYVVTCDGFDHTFRVR